MTKLHLKRLNAPKTWPIKRKTSKYIIRPNPSGHLMSESMPLTVLMKEVLKFAKTTKEVIGILHDKEVLINNQRRKDHAASAGLMDVVTFKDLDASYRILFDSKGKLVPVAVDQKEASLVPCKIAGKSTLKGAKTQLNFTSGTNLVVDKADYKVGDVVVVDVAAKKIVDHFTLAKGNHVYVTGGRYMGSSGVVEVVEGNVLVVKTAGGELLETAKRYGFAIGKDKACIALATRD